MPRSQAPKTQRKKAAPALTRAFLFSDLRDYTSFVEAKGDAAAARLLKDYRTLVRREVARHDGAEVKTEGDSFYVVFEAPSVALDCAVAILRAADLRNGRDPTAPLRIGVGLHAGETVAYDDQFVGSAVNIASRLAGRAGAGELLISDTLRGLVRTSQHLQMAERGALDLKGVSEPIRAWSVAWQQEQPRSMPSAPPSFPPAPRHAPTGQFLCPVVIGRAQENKTLEQRLAAAAGSSGGTVLLAGEAGVGKSAFVRQATDLASARGFRVLTGLTHQSDAGLPYAPFVSAVRSGFRGLDRDELGRVLQRSAPDLAELFPELGRLSRPQPTGIERHRLAVAFQHLFYAFSREAPVLIVLEDLHWADEASLELLQHLARELRDSRILVLGTYRSDEMHRRHPFLRTLAELQRERLVTEIALKRLTAEETKEVIRATFAQSDPSVTVSDEFRDAIHARSEGNPFFTEELLKALVESGGVYFRTESGWERKPIDELEIPGSIREAVRERTERLTDEARRTLAAAAVIGQRFSFDVVRAVRGVDEALLEAHLREFIEQQLVNEASGGRDEYAFRHALTREVVYDDLLVRERKRLHRGVAEALAARRDAEPALLANHLLAAGEEERAVPVLIDAAERAMRADAPREAAAHYARAIEIGVPDADLARTVERQAEAYQLFDTALSIKAADEALALYRQSGDRRGQSRALRLGGRGHFYEGRHDLAESRTQEAIDVLTGEECQEMGRAIAQLAGLKMTRQAMSEAIPPAEQAIVLGERFGDQWTLANALITKGSALRGELGLPFLRRGLDVALAGGFFETAGRAYNNTVISLLVTGASSNERAAVVEEGLAYARRHGIERGMLSYLLSQRLLLEFGTGNWDTALATLEQIHEKTLVYRWALVVRAWITAARRRPEAALPIYADLATRTIATAGDPTGPIMMVASRAAGLGEAGLRDDARIQLDALAETLARYSSGARDLETPRSAIGGWVLLSVLSAALHAEAPRWIDDVEAEIRSDGLGPAARRFASATRAIFSRDTALCARELDAAHATYDHIGFGGLWHHFLVSCVLAVSSRGLAFGPEWSPIATRTREFAARAGARWWQEVLDKARL